MNGILLSWTIPIQVVMGSLSQMMSPKERLAFDPNFDEFGDYPDRAIQTLNILDSSFQLLTQGQSTCYQVQPTCC